MSAAAICGVVRRLGPSNPPTDADLVVAFAGERDPDAFAALVDRHGPTVLGVCQRVIGNAHDAEDAFQAVFIVLARKVRAVRPPGAVGGWLYGVAVRTANKARVASARRRRREMIAATNSARRNGKHQEDPRERAELQRVLDDEVGKLPEALRAVVVLCDLHGKTRAETARELGCPEGTIAARLHRARKKLGDALARRGLALPAAGIATMLAPAAVSASAARSAVAAALGSASPAVLALAREVTRGMASTTHMIAMGVVALLAGGLVAAATMLPNESSAEPPPAPPALEVKVNHAAGEPAAGWRESKVLEMDGWLAGSVAYSGDGRVLYVGGTSGGGHVRAYTTNGYKLLWEYKGAGAFPALALSPDGKTLAVTTKDGVQFLDSETGKAGDRLEETGSEPLAVGYFPDTIASPGVAAHKLIFGNAGGYFVKSWLAWPKVGTINTITVAEGAKPADEHAVPLAVSPDGKRVVVTGPNDRDTGKNVLWAWSAGSGEANKLLAGHKAVMTCAAWSRDGKAILTGDAEGIVIAWDGETFKEKSRRRFGPRVAAVAVSPDGKHLAAAVASLMPAPNKTEAYTEEVFVWQPADHPEGEPQGKIIRRQPEGIVEINIGSDCGVKPGRTFIVLPADYPEKGPRPRVYRAPDSQGRYREVERFVPKATIEVTEVIGRNLSRARITKETDYIRDGAATSDLIYAEDAPPPGTKPLFRNDAGGPFKGVASVAFAPDGKSLAVAFANFTHLSRLGELAGKVRIFTVAGDLLAKPPAPAAAGPGKWSQRAVLTHHAGPVDSVAFAPDSKSFVSGGADGKVLLWNTGKLEPRELGMVAPAGQFTAVAYSPNGRLVAVTRDKVTGFFDPEKLQPALMNPPFRGGRGVSFSPDGKWVATSDGYTTGFRAPTVGGGEAFGSRPGTLEGQLPAPVAWSADSLYLASIMPREDGNWMVGIMGVTSETKPRNLDGHKSKVHAVAWSKDGKLLASGGEDGTIILWDGSTFEELRRTKLEGRDGGPTRYHGLAFSPDGKTLAAAVTLGSGKAVHHVVLLDTDTMERGGDLFPPAYYPIRSLAFAPHGRLLVGACGIDRTDLKPQMTPDEMKAAGSVVVWERKP